MNNPDSMFLLEIVAEELKSYINCREFVIKSQFANIFSINLNNPNELNTPFPKRPRKSKLLRRTTVRNSKFIFDKPKSKLQSGQSILFASNIDTLASNMKQYPMELSLWSMIIPDYKIGSTQIPWSATFIDYLNKLHRRQTPAPLTVKGDYNVFDEFTSKRMAVITLNMKLSYLKENITTQLRSLSAESQHSTFRPSSLMGFTQDKSINLAEETGVIKTIYSSGKSKSKIKKKTREKKKHIQKNYSLTKKSEHIPPRNFQVANTEIKHYNRKFNDKIEKLVKSETSIDKGKTLCLMKSKSCTLRKKEKLNILSYVFGDDGPFGNQVYCVGYFTIENDLIDTPKGSTKGSTKSSPSTTGSHKSAEASTAGKESDKVDTSEKYKFKICERECRAKITKTESDSLSVCSLDLPQAASHLISVRKCDRVDCNNKSMRQLPAPPDDRVLLAIGDKKKECCVSEQLEEVLGGLKAKMTFGEDPCFCECECKFGFTKRTTFCNICGGYETVGEDHARVPGSDMPFPCPIFHKLPEKGKSKVLSTSGSDSKKKDSTKQRSIGGDILPNKSVDSMKEKKGKKKKKTDDRFKFNYGYSAPQIGHSRCGISCSAAGTVPKHMGWLWTADNVPGLKLRPNWKPGAANKHVVRQLRMAKNPGEVLGKKRKRDSTKPKRPLKRPLLIVQKKDGEYTVTMETMKTFTKPRTFNQYPYEDKPVVTYTIGRTEEENRERRKKKERSRRRLERLQREFIQSAFRDMCEEICLKTYQQALGILPDAEKPDCTCYPPDPGPDHTDLDHSCSCSEDKSLSQSDTDSDEWIIEFTPPNATFDPTFKGKKLVYADAVTQYTYLDYRVKLVDRFGNPMPRFFKDLDGNEQCSDLGGFFGPDGKWLEINTDGYIGPDEKWAPNIFIGPNGETVEAEQGKFQTMSGEWLVVGVDGYIDAQGRWKSYKPKETPETKKRKSSVRKKSSKKEENAMPDQKLLLSAIQDLLAQGEDTTIPEPLVPRSARKSKTKRASYDSTTYGLGRKCKHATPSDKGVIAVDGHGHKTYFRLKDVGNKRPKQRIAALSEQGISLSSFHVPCFHSFISSELMKQQQLKRLQALALAKEAKAKGAGAEGANANNTYNTTTTTTTKAGVADVNKQQSSMFTYHV